MIDFPTGTIEVERLYNQVIASQARCITMTAAEREEGVSTIVQALAHALASHGRSVLIIDFNCVSPSISQECKVTFVDTGTFKQSIEQNVIKTSNENIRIVPAPVLSQFATEFRSKEKLQEIISDLKNKFEFILFDTNALNCVGNAVIPADLVCSCADAAVLVVLAGRTIETKVIEAVSKLRKSGANVIGTVFNDQFNPSLLDSLELEESRLNRWMPKYMARFQRALKRKGLLTIEV